MKKIALICILVVCGSCDWFKKNVEPIAKDVVVDCGKPAMVAEVENLVPAVLAIISGGKVNWKAQLDALKVVGKEALVCTVAVIERDLTQPPANGTALAPSSQPAGKQEAAARAQEYLKDNKNITAKF